MPLSPFADITLRPTATEMPEQAAVDQNGQSQPPPRPNPFGDIHLNPFEDIHLKPEPRGLLSSIGHYVWDAAKEESHNIVQALKYVPPLETPSPWSGPLPTSQPGYQSVRAKDEAQAAEGDKMAAERLRRGDEGGAFVASMLASEVFAGATAVTKTARALKFLAGGALGGATYGAIRPTEDNESRLDAVEHDMLLFPVAGAALHGFAIGAGKLGSKIIGSALGKLRPFIAGSALSKEAVNALADVNTEAEASALTRNVKANLEALFPGDHPHPVEEAEVAAQKTAVEAAVRGEVIRPSISFAIPETPEATPEQRKVWDQVFGSMSPSYKATYTKLRNATTGSAFDRQLASIISMEESLSESERSALVGHEALAMDKRPSEITGLLSQGDKLGAIDQAMENAVEATPLKSVATPELQQAHSVWLSSGGEPVGLPGPAKPLLLSTPATQTLIGKTAVSQELMQRAIEANDASLIANHVSLTEVVEGGISKLRANQEMLDRLASPVDIRPVGAAKAAVEKDAGKLIARLPEKEYRSFFEAAKRFLISEDASISKAAAASISRRAAFAVTGGFLDYVSNQVEDPTASRNLKVVAGLVAGAALYPGKGTREWVMKSEFGRKVIGLGNLDMLLTHTQQGVVDEFRSIGSKWRAMGVIAGQSARKIFANVADSKAATYALDDPSGPEFHLLSREQQNEVMSLHTLRTQMATHVQNLGLKRSMKEFYIAHLFPRETFNQWKAAYNSLEAAAKQKTATVADQQAVSNFEKVKTIEAWAKARNLAGPITDLAAVQSSFMSDYGSMLAHYHLTSTFKDLGMVHQVPDDQVIPAGFRKIRAGLENVGMMAPDGVALALTRAAQGAGNGWAGEGDKMFDVLDGARGAMMKSVMLLPWEHGLNGLRAALAIDGSPMGYVHAFQAIDQSSPALMEWAKWSSTAFRQPDYLAEHAALAEGAFKRMMTGVFKSKGEATAEAGIALSHYSDRILWNRTIPAVGFATYTREMDRWAERTGGKFANGSPEYNVAARAAGRMSDNVMGKLPELMESKPVAALARAMLFSPHWLATRLAITANAVGDIAKVAAGEISPKEARYLQYKLKSVFLGAAVTYAISIAWGKKAPSFNPNTSKLYAHTGIYDRNGREQGVDIVGWWQDDVKLLDSPRAFLASRQSPLWNIKKNIVDGTDSFGNQISNGQTLEQIMQSVGGPLGAAVSTGFKAAQPGPMSGSDKLRAFSDVTATGNVSTLPTLTDLAYTKMSEKIMTQMGIGVTRDKTQELAKLLRQDYQSSQNPIGSNVRSWLAWQQQQDVRRFPEWAATTALLRRLFDRTGSVQ